METRFFCMFPWIPVLPQKFSPKKITISMETNFYLKHCFHGIIP